MSLLFGPVGTHLAAELRFLSTLVLPVPYQVGPVLVTSAAFAVVSVVIIASKNWKRTNGVKEFYFLISMEIPSGLRSFKVGFLVKKIIFTVRRLYLS